LLILDDAILFIFRKLLALITTALWHVRCIVLTGRASVQNLRGRELWEKMARL
jgi:hypothetical protein